MPIHKQIPCSFEGEDIAIDEEIYSLIKNIWKLGLRTDYSCQDSEVTGKIIIFFQQLMHGRTFINTIISKSDLAIDRFELGRMLSGIDWEIGLWNRKIHNGRMSFGMHISFPRIDLAFVERKIQETLDELL